MKNTVAFILIMLMLPGCAVVRSESYFAADTLEGKPEWTGDPGVMHITGKPNSIRYTQDEIDFTVHASHISSRTYSIGPCLPFPLPLIPVFGLDRSDHTGPVQISFHVLQSKILYQLIRATLLADNRSLAPKKIDAYNNSAGEGRSIPHETFLPVSLIDKSAYVLTYDMLISSTAVYELVYYMQDVSGSNFIKGKILFKQDSSTTFVCIF